ncbi:MAG: methionine gamma-lyase family protein [Acutalibacteraceae bacterium]|nr:methionine gamma-lyase family protein [Acutalibacteraceae bacterium]
MNIPFYNIDEKILTSADKAMELVKDQLAKIDEIQDYNTQKMLYAFQKAGISESHFSTSTGYGFDDRGREALDEIYATVFDAEDALVRHNFVCGTHALTVALFGMLRPGDTMLSVTGTPYDTLQSVIGLSGNYSGSLKDFGIIYDEVKLTSDGKPDYNAIEKAITPDLKMVYIQRSRGYELRPSLLIDEIAKIAEIAKKKAPNTIVMLDNCYGEFVEKEQPLTKGVDIMAGSLIKNAGGGIAPTGGYIAGKTDLVQQCAYRLTTPGIGKEQGATLGVNRELFLGAFNAPHATGEALKTAVFASALFEILGFDTTPRYNEKRGDIIQLLKLGSNNALVAFCEGIQKGGPVDSFVTPQPADMPGYESKVVMAAGAFTLGSTIELSADAPLREPYAVWMQGGLNFHSARVGVLLAAQSMLEKGLISFE